MQTATQKIESKLGKMNEAQITETYGSVFRFWVKTGRTDASLSRLMRMIEDRMDDMGMDTDAIIDGLAA